MTAESEAMAFAEFLGLPDRRDSQPPARGFYLTPADTERVLHDLTVRRPVHANAATSLRTAALAVLVADTGRGVPELAHLVQVGLRAYCQEEVEYAHRHGIMQLPMHVIRANYHPDFGGWQQEVVSRLHKNVYVTFDVDGLDPSIMPATGTPVPGGLKWDETIELFRQIKAAGKKIVGLDMVELAPHPAHPHCDFTVAQLIYNILNFAL